MFSRTPLRRKSPLRSQSMRTVEQRALREAFQRAVLIRDGYTCRMHGRSCTSRLDVHHLHPVGRGGPRYDVDNGVTLCRQAHSYWHLHPIEAREQGWLR